MTELTQFAHSSTDIAVLVAALADHDGLTRQKARAALVDIGHPAVPRLVAVLADTDRTVRWEAAHALQDISDPAAAPALVVALEDSDFDVRWLAAMGLIGLGRKALEPLLAVLVMRGDHLWLRQGAHHVLKTLASHGLPAVVAPVLVALEGVEPELMVPPVAKVALEALQR